MGKGNFIDEARQFWVARQKLTGRVFVTGVLSNGHSFILNGLAMVPYVVIQTILESTAESRMRFWRIHYKDTHWLLRHMVRDKTEFQECGDVFKFLTPLMQSCAWNISVDILGTFEML